jgi:hypothetical protein
VPSPEAGRIQSAWEHTEGARAEMNPSVEDIFILTAVTPNYLPYLAVQLLSACESAAQTTRLNYTILHVGITKRNKKKLRI